MQLKGRYFVVGWTTVFLAVAAIIVARDRRAFVTRDSLSKLRSTIRILEGTRTDLEAKLAEAGGRDVLGARIAARGYHFPTDAELTLIPVPRSH